jgi:hypothetical protein
MEATMKKKIPKARNPVMLQHLTGNHGAGRHQDRRHKRPKHKQDFSCE